MTPNDRTKASRKAWVTRKAKYGSIGRNVTVKNSVDRCRGCGGPYLFDTSIPSVVWNSVIRAQGLPEYLCLTCIVQHFALAGVSFTAELSGNGFRGMPIVVEINGAAARDVSEVNDENNRLRRELFSLRAEAQTADAVDPVAGSR